MECPPQRYGEIRRMSPDVVSKASRRVEPGRVLVRGVPAGGVFVARGVGEERLDADGGVGCTRHRGVPREEALPRRLKLPEALTTPSTSSVACGEVVPMPTFPAVWKMREFPSSCLLSHNGT